MKTFRVCRNDPSAFIPSKAHTDDAGFDLSTPCHFVLWPLETKMIDTEVSIELEPGYEAQIRGRSGLSRRGIIVPTGTIDAGYRGTIGVILINLSDRDFKFQPGDRIAQMVIAEIPGVRLVEGAISKNTDRGANGFGSTGVGNAG